ncbi:phosphoribosylformylglycinamidine synthase [Rothia aeria]|uniref:Phosphoribosylformylglycinamidine synthase subunit PurL n=2 Tax=Micrococcaceae TaxID=1268 RepID=A0A2Z5QXG2_9MICC|nr:phosphoribosylformylglycinamidine synthase [Rothia aeria]
MSESQERMMAVVSPENVERFEAIMKKWGVEYSFLGEVTDTGRLIIEWDGQVIVDVDPRTVAHDGPTYERPYARPAGQDALQADHFTGSAADDARPRGEQLGEAIKAFMASPNMCSKSWITNQYDRYVQGNTALSMPDDSGVVRVDENTNLGVALATDASPRFTYLDPYEGARASLAEAYRNVATVGARPVAVSDCLNFGSPEDPDVMWQFAEAVRGLADGCMELGVPVTGGNVSLYNQTGGKAINPTPVVAMMGVMDDVTRRTPSGWAPEHDGQAIYLLGTTRDELDGSEWARFKGHLGGLPPKVDLAVERQLGDMLVNMSRDGMIDAAHDVAAGGLAAALAEACLRFNTGARIGLGEVAERDGLDLFTLLFSESLGRVVVSVPRSEEVRFKDMCTARQFPFARIGVVDALSNALDFQNEVSINLDELRAAHEGTMAAHFGEVAQG